MDRSQWSASSLSPTRRPLTVNEGRNSSHNSRRTEPELEMQGRSRLDRYGGKSPSASLNNTNTAVVVHNSSMGNSIWYWVGRMDDISEKLFWAEGRHFDYGLSPSVSLKDSGLVVEAHRSQWTHELKYTIGKVEGDLIKWGTASTYTNGIEASVDVNNNDTVVEVHERDDKHIEYKLGEVSAKQIQWSSSNVLGEGTNPRVTINDSNTVAVVYQSTSQCKILCQIGITNKMAVYWGKTIEYGVGLNPCISLAANDCLVILRQGLRLDELVYGIAKVNGRAREIIENPNVEKCRNRMLCEHVERKHVTNASSNTYWHPSVSISNEGKVLVVYGSMSCRKGRMIWYQVGRLDDTEDDEEDRQSYTGSDNEDYLSSPSDEC